MKVSDITRTLESNEHGDPKAAAELLPVVYAELRHLAAHSMAREAPRQTLQPTALVQEASLRLTGKEDGKWSGCAHFFAAAAEAMRRIPIETPRRKRALRHGGSQQRRKRRSWRPNNSPDKSLNWLPSAVSQANAASGCDAQRRRWLACAFAQSTALPGAKTR